MGALTEPEHAARGAPTLIVIGGPHGSGKTAIATRLSRDLGIPRLDPDVVQRAIKSSEAFQGDHTAAIRIGYAVVWALARDLLHSGQSAIIDVNMGWELSWNVVDELIQEHPGSRLLPILLSCPEEVVTERIRQRHRADPATYAPPELFEHASRVRDFLDTLSRPDLHSIDAARTLDEVYAAVRALVMPRISASPRSG